MNAMTVASSPTNTEFQVSQPAAVGDLSTTKVVRFGVYVKSATTKYLEYNLTEAYHASTAHGTTATAGTKQTSGAASTTVFTSGVVSDQSVTSAAQLIFQRSECSGTTVANTFDLGAAIDVNGIAVIPRHASADSTFVIVASGNLASNKLLVDLCFGTRAANQDNCPAPVTGVKTQRATFFTVVKAKAITKASPDSGENVLISNLGWNGVCNSSTAIPLCRTMMGTTLGTVAANGAITNTTLWLQDENSEHAHRIVYETEAMGGVASAAKTFIKGVTLGHTIAVNTSTTAQNVNINSSVDAKKGLKEAQSAVGMRMFVDTMKLGSVVTTSGASTTMHSQGYTNIATTNAAQRVRQDSKAATNKLVTWGMSDSVTQPTSIQLEYKLKTVKRTSGNTAKKDLSAIVTANAKWAEKINSTTSVNVSQKATIKQGSPVTETAVISTLSVIPRGSAALSVTQVAATADFVEGQYNVCFKDKATGTACPGTAASLANKASKFFLQIGSSTAMGTETDYDTIQYTADWTLQGSCATSDAQKACGRQQKTFGSDVTGNTAAKKVWFTHVTDSKGWSVEYDSLSMGSVTAVTLASAMHLSANTVTNAWTQGTSASAFSATCVSGIPKTAGLSVHPSTSTQGWTVTVLSSIGNNERLGQMKTADNTKQRLHVNGVYAVNNVSQIGVADGSASTIVLHYQLKTIKRYNAATAGINLTTKVAGKANNKWLQAAVGSNNADKFQTVGLQADVSDNATSVTAGTKHVVQNVVVVPRHATALKLNKVTVANATSTGAFLTQDVCLQSKTTADNAACPTGTTASPDPTWPMAEAHFFMQVSTAANATNTAWNKNIYAGEWTLSGACADATTLASCRNFMKDFGSVSTAAASQTKFWVAHTSYAAGWQVAYDANTLSNALSTSTLNKAKTLGGTTNKVTPWSTTAKIAVETDMPVTNSLGKHPSAVTYGWTVTAMTKSDLQGSAMKGLMLTSDNTLQSVRVEADFAAGKIAHVGVGKTSGIDLAYTLKTVKRLNGATLVANLSTTVAASSERWGVKSNSATGKKFQTVGTKSKISVNEATGTKTDHVASVIVVVPREATATKIHSVSSSEATDAGAFLKHDVCLREKTTTAATCPTGAAPVAGVQVPMNTAKFFQQIWSVAAPTPGKSDPAYDSNELAAELAVSGDCNSTASMKDCHLFGKTFGSTAAAGALNDFYVTRGAQMLEAFHVTFDAKAMGNSKAQTLAAAQHQDAVTNKVALWTGVAPAGKALGWTTLAITSTAKNANNLGKHPSTLTYGFTVVTMTQADALNTSRTGMLSSADNTKQRIRADTAYAAGVVNRLGVANPSTDVNLEQTLVSIKRMTKAAKAGDKETSLDMTTKVTATSCKWMEKANGSADADKFQLMGSQSTVSSAAAAPKEDSTVQTIAVVPRHATALKLASVTVANATLGSANLKHDVCMTGTKKATDAACPTTKVQIPMNEASFFTQAVTTATVSKALYDNVDFAQQWKLNGACDDKAKVANCSVFFDVQGKAAQDANASKNVAFVATTDGKSTNVDGWKVAYDATAQHNATADSLAKLAGGAAITHDVHQETSDKINHIQVDNVMRMAKANTLGKHPSTVTYGQTVTKFDAAGLDALDADHLDQRASTSVAPFQLFSVRNRANEMTFAEKAGATVDATTGAFKAGAKAATILADTLTTVSGGEDVASFTFNQTDNRNDVTALTTDDTNKSERFSSTNVLISGTQQVRVSQAFVLQTAKHTQKAIPKAQLTGAAADVTFDYDGVTTALMWAVQVSPETAITKADSVTLELTVSMGGMCTAWESTDVGGEGDINCLWQTDKTGFTVYLTDSTTQVRFNLPSSSVDNAQKTQDASFELKAEEEPAMSVKLTMNAKLEAVTDSVTAVCTVTGGKQETLPAPKVEEKEESGEGEETVQPTFASLVFNLVVSLFL